MSKKSHRFHGKADNTAHNYNSRENIVDLNSFRKPSLQKVKLLPKNLSQEAYIDALEDSKKHIVFGIGPAGTGKTFLSTSYAIQSFQKNTIDKIIITRPAVSVDEKHGFLPGSLVDKMEPWIMPILDVFYLFYSKKEVEKLIEYNKLEVSPLAYMRGRNFANSIVLGDEMQNSTPSQMKMLLTRIGEGSKLIITGDLEQHDAGYEKNGLLDFIQRFENHSNISITKFSNRDVERHPIIEDILSMYKNK